MRLIRLLTISASLVLLAAPAARAQGHANIFVGSNFSGDAGRSLSAALNDGSRLTWGGAIGGTMKGIFGAEVDLAYARHFYGSNASLGNNYVLLSCRRSSSACRSEAKAVPASVRMERQASD